MVAGLAPGKLRRDRDRGKVDLRQRRHRQQREDHQAHQENAAHQQRGGDRSADERFGNAHDAFGIAVAVPVEALAVVARTCAPGCRRYWLLVTTRSLKARPPFMTVIPPLSAPIFRGRTSTVESLFTT